MPHGTTAFQAEFLPPKDSFAYLKPLLLGRPGHWKPINGPAGSRYNQKGSCE